MGGPEVLKKLRSRKLRLILPVILLFVGAVSAASPFSTTSLGLGHLPYPIAVNLGRLVRGDEVQVTTSLFTSSGSWNSRVEIQLLGPQGAAPEWFTQFRELIDEAKFIVESDGLYRAEYVGSNVEGTLTIRVVRRHMYWLLYLGLALLIAGAASLALLFRVGKEPI